MTVVLKTEIVLSLTPAEFRLISSALRGTLKTEDKAAAYVLQDEMVRSRQLQAEQYAKNVKIKDGDGC